MAAQSKPVNPKWDHIFTKAEFRRLRDALLKAAIANQVYGVPERECANRLGLTKSRVRRAVEAYRHGRVPGLDGRPTIFSDQEEKEIEQYILEKTDKLESLSRFEIVDYVRCFSRMLIL